MQTIETIKREFHNALYKRNRIIQLIYAYISYDQQSKSKENFKQVRSWLKQASRKGKKLKGASKIVLKTKYGRESISKFAD